MPISDFIAQSRRDYFREESPTHIDIRPEASTTATRGFFSADGPSFRDALDAINPLNHIPIVSSLFEKATDHQASVAAKLVGGALFGGPVGFAVSLASTIFEGETGANPSDTLVAAIEGTDKSPTELASAPAPAELAMATPPATPASASASPILTLYGDSPASAHAAYRDRQFRPYLQQVTTSQVL